MKTSSSSSSSSLTTTLLLLLFLLFLSTSANSRFLSSRNLHHCNSFSNTTTRSLCFKLEIIYHKNMHSVPIPPQENNWVEVDPRYGVDKRLVPSGPNPLHN
ncbi:CLAVATA3/ESR-RELATED [Trifolium repens]|nr:CLAVATA3/ESR-RELATED [Trifolium repens]